MAEYSFRGSGGGGGGSSYKMLPDNLRSNDSFELLVGLGSGRWKGLTRGLKSLEVNNVPLENEDGTTNFQDFAVVFADGDPANQQQVLFKLGGGGGTTTVNTQIGNTNASGPGPWVTGAVTTPNADFIDIRLVVSQLYYQDKDGARDATATLELEMKPSGAATWINPLLSNTAPTYNPDGFTIDDGFGNFVRAIVSEASYDTSTTWNDPNPGKIVITNKTTSPAVKEIRIAVPKTGNYVNKTWQVRIRLVEKELVQNDPIEERRTISFETIAAITKTPLGDTPAWNSLAWLQVIGKATNQLSGIPELRGEYDTKIIKTPPSIVYNPVTRQYTGTTWNGTYTLNFTSDPAWCIKDLIEDPISGIAALAPGATLDKWDALEASKYYSELVSDGNGGTHPRLSLNLKIDQQQNAEELIQFVAGSVNSICFDTGDGKWRLKVDKPENPVMIFTRDNIEGDFGYQHTDVDSRFNDFTLTFANKDNKYQEDRVRVFDQAHIDRFGRKPTTIAGVGCTNRQEALRRAYIRLRSSINEYRMVNFTTNRQALFIQPLDTILVADTDLGYVPPTGYTTGDPDTDTTNNRTTTRLEAIAGTTLTLGSSVRLERGATYTVSVTYPNPNYNPDITTQPANSDWTKPTLVATRTVTNANTVGARGDTTTLTIDSAFPAGVNVNAPIALSAVGMPTLPVTYRVLAVTPADDGERVSINAIIVDTGKWTATDTVTEAALAAQSPSTIVDPPVLPSTGMFSVKTYVGNFDIVKRTLVVRWERPGSLWLNGFDVDYNFNDGPWISLAVNTPETQLEFPDPLNGKYTFRIIANDRRIGQSAPLIGVYTLSDVITDYPAVWDSVVGDGRPSDNAVATYRQATMPTDISPGTIWFDTSDGNRERVSGGPGFFLNGVEQFFNGEPINLVWLDVQDQAIQTVIDSAESTALALEKLSDDGILTPNEKIAVLIPKYAAFEGIWSILDNQAGIFGNVIERAQALARRAEWNNYLVSLVPAWNDTTQNTEIVRDVFNLMVKSYELALKALEKALTDYAAVSGPDLQTPAGLYIYADSAGTITTPLPTTFRCRAFQLGVDVSPDTNFTATFSNGITGSINNTPGSIDRGVVTITAFSFSGNIVVNALNINRQIPVDRVNAPPTVVGGAGSSSAFDASLDTINSSSFTAVSEVLTVTSSATGTLNRSLSTEFEAIGIGVHNIEVRIGRRLTSAGGAYTYDTIITGQGTSPDPDFGINSPGYVAFANAVWTGLTASVDYDCVLEARKISGSNPINFISSSFSIHS